MSECDFPSSPISPPLQAALELGFLPDKNVPRTELFPLGRGQSSGDQWENVETNGLKDNMSISRITDICKRKVKNGCPGRRSRQTYEGKDG
jgi:hypothetical protein